MIELQRLEQMPFFCDMPPEALVGLAQAAVHERLPAGHVLLRQYDRARAVHFLVSGSVQILIRVGTDDLLVAVLAASGDVIGWSAFRPPYRYTASVRCENVTEVVTVPVAAFNGLFECDPGLAYVILRKVASAVADRVQQAQELLASPPRQGPVGGRH